MTAFLILLVIGIALICLEVFVPGGILGALGAAALVAAMIVSFFVFPQNAALLISVGIILLMGLILVLFIRLFPRSPIGRQMTLGQDSHGYSATQDGLEELAGKDGEARSDLRPGGFATIGGSRVDVVSEGGMIEKGSRIRVVRIEGNRVVVRKLEG